MNGIEEIEEMLARELGQVAGGLRVPPQPETPGRAAAPSRRWIVPLAVAAAVVLVLAGVTVVLSRHDNHPTPTHTIPKSLPSIPFTVGRTLYVDGKAMPGKWSVAMTAGDSWTAARTGGLWWGHGRTAHKLPAGSESMPTLSSDGKVIAFEQRGKGTGKGRIRVLDTATGRILGTWHLDLGKAGPESKEDLVAVTSPSVRVVVEGVTKTGAEHSLVWDMATGSVHPLEKNYSVQTTMSGQMIVSDLELHYRLGTVDADGSVHPSGGTLPLSMPPVSSDGWYAAAARTRSVKTDKPDPRGLATQLVVARLGGADKTTIDLPDGWGAVNVAWEAPGQLVVDGTLMGRGNGPAKERLIRCVVGLKRCAIVPR